MNTRVLCALAVVMSALSPASAAALDAAAAPVDSLAVSMSVRLEPLADGVTVFYFHRTIRCVTCIAAEALADTLIHEAFAPQIVTGRLAWTVVNVDEAGNEQFVDRYGLGPFGLVISVRSSGEEVSWRELKSIEDLVAYRGLFDEYVREETQHALDILGGGTDECAQEPDKEGDSNEDARGVLP
jgi:hypothetical protein